MKKNARTLLSCLLLTCTAMPAHALDADDIGETIKAFLQTQTRDMPGLVSVSVKPPGERQLALQRCMQAQAFLPQGQKPWGRVTIGVRCVNGPNASLYVSAQVKVEGSYVKLTRPVSGGQTIDAGDVQIEQGELTAHPGDLVLTLNQAIGQTARQALSPGQALRSGHLRQAAGILAGQQVKVIANGGGFSVVNHGRALNNAAQGTLTRVKLENGQIVSGIATNDGAVDVSGSR